MFVAVLFTGGSAFAFWVASTPSTVPAAVADVLPQGATPSVPTTSGPNGGLVTVSFTQSATTNGTSLTDYSVKRYAVGSIAASESFSCTGSNSPVSCNDPNVPSGQWQYTDTPLYGTNWIGTESAKSPPVVVGTTASLPDPPGGRTPVPPHFYNGNVEGIRSSGSATTLSMMQVIGELYTGAGLYGCTLNDGAGQTLYNSSDPASTAANEGYYCQAGADTATSDVNDNWDRTEVTEGVDDIGWSAGQNQLCGALPTPLPVDFARSATPAGTACSTLAEAGFAKDGIPIIDYPVNPSAYGTSTRAPYSSVNGGVVGPVAEGWLPGDPTSGPFTGTALNDIDNDDNGGGESSTAYRLWCETTNAGSPITSTSQITDWGALTNLGPDLLIYDATLTSGSPDITINPDVDGTFATTVAAGDAVSGPGIPSGTTVRSASGGTAVLSNDATSVGLENLRITTAGPLAVGQGMPIGVPIRLLGITTSSDAESTFALFANSGGGTTAGGCASSMNPNAPSDPNPLTEGAGNTGPHIAGENDAEQVGQFAAGDFPSPDYVDQAIEVATTLYVESNGVFNTNPYAAAVTINGTSYSGNKVEENGMTPFAGNLLDNSFPTAVTLYNLYRTDTVRASTGGFLNWICDGDDNFDKGLVTSTGVNFDSQLTTTISSVYGFPRLTDTSAPTAITTPADGQPAPNTTCAASLTVTTSGSTITLSGGGSFPPDIVDAGDLYGKNSTLPQFPNDVGVIGLGIPVNDYVVSGQGTGTLTLNAPVTTNESNISVTFTGVPAVTSVANAGT